jgi:hypothetical protein
MSAHVLPIAFFLGGALLAPWIDARVPRIGPNDLGKSLFHVIGAVAALDAMALLFAVVAGDGTPARRFLALFVVVLPCATYICLAKFWLLKLVASRAPSWR